MTDTRDDTTWPAVADLVGELAELPPADRQARLAALAPPTRQTVQRYLTAYDASAAFARPAADLLAEFASPDDQGSEPHLAPGQVVGRWQVVRLIGQGGMGTVYEAVRTEEGFTQRAALKMVRSDRGTGVTLDRFRRERELLARLRHRNIAALVDGGVTDAGRPWYAMELVDGEPITSWCDARRLTPPARVRLFRQVCAAVHHAHRELIVHRDLKPGNILVTADGTVKLLDFGIAKLLDPSLDRDDDLTMAGWGAVPATPNYASPEQLAGQPVTVASDVYALGVVLYQLLGGTLPFRFEGDAAGHRRRVETEAPPPLPRVATVHAARMEWPTARVLRWLGGDVDRVVQMALRKEPDRRYASADQLGSDLERLVAGRPVIARPDGAWYRFRLFVARNPLAASVSALLTAGLVIATLTAVDRARRADTARVAADAAAARAARVTDFLADLLGAPDPWVGDRDITVRQLLGEASARAGVVFAADAASLAEVRLSLGRAFRGLGQWENAAHEFGNTRTAARAAGLDQARFSAELGLGEILAEQGELPAARAWYDSATATARAAGDSLGLAAVAADLAALFGASGQQDSAAIAATRAVDLRTRYPADPIDLANAFNNLAVSLLERGNPDSADVLIAESIRLLRQAGPAGAPALAAALATEAGMRSDQRDFAGADRSYRESLDLRRRIFGYGHPDEIGTLVNLGANAVLAGRYQEATNHADTVIARIGPHGLPPDHALAAAARTVRGRALVGQGRAREAEIELRQALTLRRAALPPGHPALAYTLVALADALDALGRRAEAGAAAREARRILFEAFGPDHPRTLAADSLERRTRPR